MSLTLASSEQVSTWEKLSRCKSACGLVSGTSGRLGQGHCNGVSFQEVPARGVEGQVWSRVGLGLTQGSGLSPFPDFWGPSRMTCCWWRHEAPGYTLCALEPSGCTPLLSRASTRGMVGPPPCPFLSSISHLTSNFHSLFTFRSSKPSSCAGLSGCGVLRLRPLFSVASQKSPSPPPQLFCPPVAWWSPRCVASR